MAAKKSSGKGPSGRKAKKKALAKKKAVRRKAKKGGRVRLEGASLPMAASHGTGDGEDD